jgi:acyl-CoA-dependent ceramide synthase
LNLRIILSEFYEFKTVGPYELNWETEQYKCALSHYISLALLASLQSLNLFWLWAIFRIAYRFVFLNIAEDDRSDNDEKELEEEQRLDALAKEAREAAEKVESPQVLVNGEPLSGKGKTTGAESRANGTTNRKGNGKKS